MLVIATHIPELGVKFVADLKGLREGLEKGRVQFVLGHAAIITASISL